jgi:hypothetical protein
VGESLLFCWRWPDGEARLESASKMKLLRTLGFVALFAVFFYFLRETVGVFADEDLAFLHYLW